MILSFIGLFSIGRSHLFFFIHSNHSRTEKFYLFIYLFNIYLFVFSEILSSPSHVPLTPLYIYVMYELFIHSWYGSLWDKTQFCTLVCSRVISSFTLLIFIDFIVMIYCPTLVYIVETVSSRIINYWFNYGDLNSQNIRKFKVHFVTSKTLFSKNIAHS